MWIERDLRYVEKLATPDVTIADMIGDVDPIKAARGGRDLSDELTIHYGLAPALPIAASSPSTSFPIWPERFRWGLFNIMQEGDVQIKGYPVRMPLDVLTRFHRQSRGLHRARKNYHASQGSHRLGNSHALSCDRGRRHVDHRAGIVDCARRAFARGCAGLSCAK